MLCTPDAAMGYLDDIEGQERRRLALEERAEAEAAEAAQHAHADAWEGLTRCTTADLYDLDGTVWPSHPAALAA